MITSIKQGLTKPETKRKKYRATATHIIFNIIFKNAI